jgi:hypothetical protein
VTDPSTSPPDRLVAVAIVGVAGPDDDRGWVDGPYRDDPRWPDRGDWRLIEKLRESFSEPFRSGICDPHLRKHRLLQEADQPDVLAAEVLVLDDERSDSALLAVHFALQAATEYEVRRGRQAHSDMLQAIVERLDLAQPASELLVELLCVPRPALVPEPQVWTNAFHGHYWHLRMWALANPGWASNPAEVDTSAIVSYVPWRNVPEHDVLVGRRTSVAVGDDFFALEALQRTVLVDVLLYAAAQHAVLRALERDAGLLADPRRNPQLAVDVARRARRYRALYQVERTGDVALDRMLHRYRELDETQRIEARLSAFEQLGEDAVAGASTLLKALGAVVGLGVAVAGLVRLTGTGTGTQIAALLVALAASAVTLLLTPFGRALGGELRRTLTRPASRQLASRVLTRVKRRG